MIRTHARVTADLYINKMIDGVPHLARSSDISRGGIYVNSLLEPDARDGAHISLEFVLPGTDEVIWAEARIAHGSHDGGAGLEFVDLPPRHADLIEAYVDSNLESDLI